MKDISILFKKEGLVLGYETSILPLKNMTPFKAQKNNPATTPV